MPRASHPHVPHPRLTLPHGLSQRIADAVANWFGSIACLYVLVVWQLSWMIAATLGVPPFNHDRYPFVFCLFLSNLIQLWALPILGTATNRADQKREAKANADHEALTHIATQVDQLVAAVADLPPTKG